MLNCNSSSAKLSSQPVPGRILSWVLRDTRGWRGHGGLPCVGTSEPLVDSLSCDSDLRDLGLPAHFSVLFCQQSPMVVLSSPAMCRRRIQTAQVWF